MDVQGRGIGGLFGTVAVRRSGFSIIELMVVLLIIGILSAVGILLVSPRRSGIEVAKNLLFSKAYEMRQKAISNTTHSILRITPGNNSFDIDPDIRATTSSLKTIVLPERIVAQRADNGTAVFTIEFQDNGTVTASSVGGIVITDQDGGKSYTLTVNRVGAMRIQ